MGFVHASNMLELERQDGVCRLAGIVDGDASRTRRFAEQTGYTGKIFGSVEEYIDSEVCKATMIVSPTELHRAHSSMLVNARHRVLCEKPLTGTLEGDIEFCAELDRDFPDGVMLAFQRRFDPALAYGQQLMAQGLIGRVFKIYSALEDSGPPPDDYMSGGILPDMSIHNVDEILWLAGGPMPDRAMVVGSLVYNQRIAKCKEDFDDAMLYLWFGEDIVGQVQVTRNHVSGYRVETIIYGEKGQIQIGHFEQRPQEIVVQAFGKRGAAEPLAKKVFPASKSDPGAPEFMERFGEAYKQEVAVFIDCVRRGAKFPTSHRDALRAQQVISCGMSATYTRNSAAKVE